MEKNRKKETNSYARRGKWSCQIKAPAPLLHNLFVLYFANVLWLIAFDFGLGTCNIIDNNVIISIKERDEKFEGDTELHYHNNQIQQTLT